MHMRPARHVLLQHCGLLCCNLRESSCVSHSAAFFTVVDWSEDATGIRFFRIFPTPLPSFWSFIYAVLQLKREGGADVEVPALRKLANAAERTNVVSAMRWRWTMVLSARLDKKPQANSRCMCARVGQQCELTVTAGAFPGEQRSRKVSAELGDRTCYCFCSQLLSHTRNWLIRVDCRDACCLCGIVS